jgi:hypothetical protein
MPAPFGFSAGDVIAFGKLIKDVFKALDNTKGAAAEYQALCRELCALHRALLEVELLLRTCDTFCGAQRLVSYCAQNDRSVQRLH